MRLLLCSGLNLYKNNARQALTPSCLCRPRDFFSHPFLSTAKLLQCQWLLLATQINDHFKPKVGYFAGCPIYLFIFTKPPSFLPLCSLQSRHLRASDFFSPVYFFSTCPDSAVLRLFFFLSTPMFFFMAWWVRIFRWGRTRRLISLPKSCSTFNLQLHMVALFPVHHLLTLTQRPPLSFVPTSSLC